MKDEMISKSQSLQYQRPLVYMWIAQYSDNTALPQFDPVDFHENSFSDIDQKRLIKFGLYPIPSEISNELIKKGIAAVSLPFLSKIEINLDKFKRLIYFRRNFISQEEYHICKKCGKEFYVSPSTKHVESKYSSPICPNCGAHDYFRCKSCGRIFNKFEETNNGLCTDCNSELDFLKITSEQLSREKRWTEYYIGYQENVHGVNRKNILKVSENGEVELVYETR